MIFSDFNIRPLIHDWSTCKPPDCVAVLAKYHPERFTLTLIMDGQQIRESVWKSKNKITDELNKAGLNSGKHRPIPWPANVGDKSEIKILNPARWYWSDV